MQGKAAILTLILSALLPNYGAECETSFDDAREVVERLRAIRLPSVDCYCAGVEAWRLAARVSLRVDDA